MPHDIPLSSFLNQLSVRLGVEYTEDEQIPFLSDFTTPLICFASPGTGKTMSSVAGLLTAELYHGISGDSIYALSFTNNAAGEIATRHKRACNHLGIASTVNFKTLHSMCIEVLKNHYGLLGWKRMNTEGSTPLQKCVELVQESLKEWDVAMPPQKVKTVVMAIRQLNSSLIFDKDHIMSSSVFKDAGIKLELFNKIRKLLFQYNFLTETVPVNDILLYTLLLLIRHPEVSDEMKKKCRIIVVDEAQDMSLLQLRVVSMFTDCLILIGDMKQQIYAFNGACQEIVDRFYELYPNARTLEFTHSFRCKNEIAEFSNKIIAPNGYASSDFVGTGPGGSVILDTNVSFTELAEKIRSAYDGNACTFGSETMFLFRNNASATPIAEALYQAKVPFRVNKFKAAFELPVIKEMVQILNLCRDPRNPSNIDSLRYVIPEFRAHNVLTRNPLYKICLETGSSVFEINYDFMDKNACHVMNTLFEVSEMTHRGATVKDLFNAIWPFYNELWVKPRAWTYEYSPDYYINLVSPIIRNKTLDTFLHDELEKKRLIEENNRSHHGVRCYTIHGAKGLEADVVYVLDADEGIIPNATYISRMTKKGCHLDAARELRNERNLCYVACTRAKYELHIVYNKEPASIILGNNIYSELDDVYKYYYKTEDDVEAYMEFIEGI